MISILSDFVVNLWTLTCQMAPALLFGFLFAGILSVFISPEYVRKHLGGRGFLPVLKASLFGVPLPLCSCSVLPVAMSIRKNGASKGAVTSFLISTPETGVDSIAVTYGMLGPLFAVVRPLVAFASGIIGGMLAEFFDDRKEQAQEQPAGEKPHCCCCHEAAEDSEVPCEVPGIFSRILQAVKYGYITLMDDIALPLISGLIIAALINIFVPENWFTAVTGGGIKTMLLMMLFGLPLYVCATASVPIAAAFILKGVSPGAALVFLITGPATNIAAIAAIWKTLGRKHTFIFLFSIIVCALGAGILLDAINVRTGDIASDVAAHCHEQLSVFDITAGTVISILLAVSAIKRVIAKFKGDRESCCHEQN